MKYLYGVYNKVNVDTVVVDFFLEGFINILHLPGIVLELKWTRTTNGAVEALKPMATKASRNYGQ